MSLVYFLGAGFSAAYGSPVMNQFFSVARQSTLLKPEEKIFLVEVQRFAHMGVRLVTISRNNMEEILSFLEMAEQAGQVPPRLTELSKVGNKAIPPLELLRSIIARVYGPLQADRLNASDFHLVIFGFDGCDPTPSFPPVQIRSPLRLPNRQSAAELPKLTFITTNYDLCLETLLLRIHPCFKLQLVGDWVSAGGHPQGQGDTSCIYDHKSPAKLIRLHGAVNWNSPGHRANGRSYKFRVISHINPQNNLPWAIFYVEGEAAPIIVAPTVFKHQADGPYAEQWCEAAKALVAATHLVFIGYSFPESDAYMRYFLGASLAENVALEAIHIIDPQADTIVQRLHKGGQYGAHFLDMLRPHNRCWHEH